MAKRIFGKKINYKSLSCAPVNEHGVVYLFGVLHDSFDFKIESIQAGFPDCIARRQISREKWEELRIEFEFESKSFVAHRHDIKGVDIIVCWKHNWKECPKEIEVIELKTMIGDLEDINNSLESGASRLTDYMLFCQQKRKQGLTLKEISPLWNIAKKEKKKDPKPKIKKALTEYNKFMKAKVLSGLTLKESAILWQQEKRKIN
jgi:hypothetical protein